MATRSAAQVSRTRAPLSAAAFLLGLASLVSLKLWILARMLMAYLT